MMVLKKDTRAKDDKFCTRRGGIIQSQVMKAIFIKIPRMNQWFFNRWEDYIDGKPMANSV